MEIIKTKLSLKKRQKSAKEIFDNFIKVVVDIENWVIVIARKLFLGEVCNDILTFLGKCGKI